MAEGNFKYIYVFLEEDKTKLEEKGILPFSSNVVKIPDRTTVYAYYYSDEAIEALRHPEGGDTYAIVNTLIF